MRDRGLALVVAGVAVTIGAWILHGESLRGFPDGHLTEWDRFVHGPSRAIGIGCMGVAAFCGWVAIAGHRRHPGTKLFVACGALAVLVLMEIVLLSSSHGLDSGQGG